MRRIIFVVGSAIFVTILFFVGPYAEIACTPAGCKITERRFFASKSRYVQLADLRGAGVGGGGNIELQLSDGVVIVQPAESQADVLRDARRLTSFIAQPAPSLIIEIGDRFVAAGIGLGIAMLIGFCYENLVIARFYRRR